MPKNQLFKDGEKIRIIGIRYSATGVFGQSFFRDGIEVFSVAGDVLPMPNIYMNGFGLELICRSVDGEITLVPGVRREILDSNNQIYGYYEYISMGEFYIRRGTYTLKVFVYEWGWRVCFGDEEWAIVMRMNQEERVRYEEDGFDKELRFKVELNQELEKDLYPLILSIPMLGF